MPAFGFEVDNVAICPVCYEKLIESSESGELILITTPPQIVEPDGLCPKCGLPYGREATKKSSKKIISKIIGE